MISLKKLSLEQKNRIDNSLKTLRAKVENYTVVDKEGQIIGEVRDLIIDDDRQLNFVISTDTENKQCFNLNSSLVKKIDSKIRCVFLNVGISEVEYLKQYFEKAKKESTIVSVEKDDSYRKINNKNVKPMETRETNNNSVFPGTAEPIEEEIIRLLGEKIVVDRTKRKVGEVIVRKEIETRMIQVPVRREKLVVEQISPEHKQLAEIDLGEEISQTGLLGSENLDQVGVDGGITVSGEFNSPKTASLLLNAIALERNHGCKAVRVTVVVENEEYEKKYQEWFSRTST